MWSEDRTVQVKETIMRLRQTYQKYCMEIPMTQRKPEEKRPGLLSLLVMGQLQTWSVQGFSA